MTPEKLGAIRARCYHTFTIEQSEITWVPRDVKVTYTDHAVPADLPHQDALALIAEIERCWALMSQEVGR